jgi:RNA polymerase sigma-70 factor, ECF subfamily
VGSRMAEPASKAPPPHSSSTSARLLLRARRGDEGALEELFARLLVYLRRWAHGRLPRWARRGVDTVDIVQDVLIRAFGRLDVFEPRQRQALRAYLRQAVRNRINDELRRFDRTGPSITLEIEPAAPTSPLADAIANETRQRYVEALGRLQEAERELVVARLELEYSYEQIALMTGRKTADAARMAVRRALLRLAESMNGP